MGEGVIVVEVIWDSGVRWGIPDDMGKESRRLSPCEWMVYPHHIAHSDFSLYAVLRSTSTRQRHSFLLIDGWKVGIVG